MKDIDLRSMIMEIQEYSSTMPDCPFYDLKAYAYRERPEWIPAFEDKDSRRFLSLYLKSKKHSMKTPYIHTTAQAMENALEAEIAYYRQKPKSD